jgi:hypothetical protein
MSISQWGIFDLDAPLGEGQLSLMWLNDYFAMCRELSWGFN